MKKTLLSALLALVLVLSGCTTAPAETTLPPTTRTEPTVPATTAAPTPENQELTRILETDGSVISLAASDRMLAVLLYDSDDTAHLATVDPATGAVLGKAPFGDPFADIVVFSDGVAAFSWNDNSLSVYSSSMELLWSRTFSAYGNLQSDGSFYLLPDDGSVVRISLADQSEQTLQLPAGMTPLDAMLCRDNRTMLRCTNNANESFAYFLLDWTDGSVTPAELDEDLYLNRNKQYDAVPGYDCTWLRSPLSDTFYRLPGVQGWVIQSTETRVLAENEESLLSCFDLENGTVISRTTSGVTNAVLCGKWVAYAELDAPGQVTLWNTALTSELSPDFRTVQAVTAEELITENQLLCEAITANTGLPVFYGPEAIDYNHGTGSGYESEPAADPLTVHLGLEQLNTLAGQLPAGFFTDLSTDTFNPVEVYLTGPIHGDVYGFDPIGFTTYTGEAQIVVLDIVSSYDPNNLRATMVHEFSHVMENRINDHVRETGLDYLAYWMSFLPDPDLYFYNYNDYLDYDKHADDYTANSERAPEEIYFLDSYSRTMPTEDQARILEHLYLGEYSPYASNLKEGVLREKALYLCALIRECFPSCQIDGKLPWETLDETVPFSAYEEAVRTYVPTAVG